MGLYKLCSSYSVQFSSVTQSCLTLCDPMKHSTAGLPVHYQLPEFTQTHVRRVGDAIQPSHPLSSPYSCPQSLPASESFPMSQLFAWGGQNIGVSAQTSVLPMNTQDWSPLGWTGWISLQSKGLSRVFSNTTVHLSKNPVKEITVYLWLVSVTVYLWFVSFFALSTNLKLFFQNIC